MVNEVKKMNLEKWKPYIVLFLFLSMAYGIGLLAVSIYLGWI